MNTFILDYKELEPTSISGTLRFVSYDNYKKLTDFLATSKKLKISYKIPSSVAKKGFAEYFKDVDFLTITKAEKETNGILSETITFNPLSLWYEENDFVYQIETNDDDLRWNFRWNKRFRDYNSKNISYKNNGHIDAPIILSIEGPVSNPEIEIYVGGELFQKVTFSVTLQKNEKFLYESTEGNSYILKENSDGTKEDLFNQEVIDIDNNNLILIPKDSVEIKIKASTSIKKASLKILPQYYMV